MGKEHIRTQRASKEANLALPLRCPWFLGFGLLKKCKCIPTDPPTTKTKHKHSLGPNELAHNASNKQKTLLIALGFPLCPIVSGLLLFFLAFISGCGTHRSDEPCWRANKIRARFLCLFLLAFFLMTQAACFALPKKKDKCV